MSLYESDPRINPIVIGAYPKRRRPATALRPWRRREPAYADFFAVEYAAVAGF